MTKKQVWRFYCGFCKKSGCSGGHIAKHERACTANPNRICTMCGHAHATQRPIAELLSVIRENLPKGSLDGKAATEKLREATEGCPACMLAAIRQSGLQSSTQDEGGWCNGVDFGFDFKLELTAFWKEVNESSKDRY